MINPIAIPVVLRLSRKEIGSTEYWSVETLPQPETGHVPQVEDFLPS